MVDMEILAAQLRQPTGELGLKVAQNMNESNGAISREAARLLNLSSTSNLLEVGMGNGGFAAEWLAANPNLHYTGADFSETMVEEATRLNAEHIAAGRARFVLADAAALPFADGEFDRILTANTLYFYSDPSAVLAEYYRVLAPGGRLVLAIRSEDTMKHMPFTQHGFTMYSRPALEALFKASPFGECEVHSFFEEFRKSVAGTVEPTTSYLAVAIRS